MYFGFSSLKEFQNRDVMVKGILLPVRVCEVNFLRIVKTSPTFSFRPCATYVFLILNIITFHWHFCRWVHGYLSEEMVPNGMS